MKDIASRAIGITGTGARPHRSVMLGFSGAARREFKSIVSALGAECLGDLLKVKTKYLVVCDAQQLNEQIEGAERSAKIKRAVEWGIPLVSYQWLLDSASIGKLLEVEPYILQDREDTASCDSVEQLRKCASAGEEPLLILGDASSACKVEKPPAHKPTDVATPQTVEPDAQSDSSCSVGSAIDRDDALGEALAQLSFCSNVEPPDERSAAAAPTAQTLQKCLPSAATTAYTGPASTFVGTSGMLACDGDCASSPEAVQVRVGKPLRTCPRGSTAPAFHGVPARRLQFYERLEVAHPGGGVRFAFSTRERSHCALVYYEDVACPGAEARELAYADLLYCYTIKGEPSAQVWVEHGYLYDRQDLEGHPMGRRFLEARDVAPCELVETSSAYHSHASVIEGEFWLTSKEAAVSKGADGHHYFCEACWDRKTGECTLRTKRSKASAQ